MRGGATDGGEAWSLFEEWRPDLVVLDVDMPIVDGIEVCRRIRELDEEHESFVLFLAGRDHPEMLEALLDARRRRVHRQADDARGSARPTDRRRAAASRRTPRSAAPRTSWSMRAGCPAIGETTLSLQHEINNPLSALLGNAELMLMEMREKGEKNEMLDRDSRAGDAHRRRRAPLATAEGSGEC